VVVNGIDNICCVVDKGLNWGLRHIRNCSANGGECVRGLK
jgi:hypothetical protein